MDISSESSPEAQAAIVCASRAASGYLLSAKTFRALVTSVQSRTEEYWRVLYLIERRSVVLRMSAGKPGADRRSLRPTPDPREIDPWSVHPSRLEQESRVVALCPHCHGAKEVACTCCQGSGRTRCGRCGGSGKVLGERKFLKNCPECRGRGDARCSACRAGRVGCKDCGADGLVEAWLALEQSTYSLVRSGPERAALYVHYNLASPKDFDAGPQHWPHRLVEDTGLVSTHPSHVPAGLLPQLAPGTERIVQARAQRFQATVFRVGYETAFSQGFLDVSGQPPAVSARSHWRPLRRRQWLMWGATALFGSAAILFWRAYALPHPWFTVYGAGNTLLWLTLLSAALATLSVARVTLSHRTHTPARIWGPLWSTAAVALAAVLLALTSVPRLAHAQRALMEGKVEEARMEALALVKLQSEVEAASTLLDTLQMQEVQAAPDLASLARQVREKWYSSQARETARARLTAQALQKEAALHEQGPPEALEQLAQLVAGDVPEVQARAQSRAALLRAASCLDSGDLPCAVSKLESAAHAPEEEYKPLQARAVKALSALLHTKVKEASQAPVCSREQAWKDTIELAQQLRRISHSPTSPSERELEALRTKAVERCAQQRQREAERTARE